MTTTETMVCIQTSSSVVVASDNSSSIHCPLEQQREEEEEFHNQDDYGLLTLKRTDRWVGATHHPECLDIKVKAQQEATAGRSRCWAADLRKLDLQGRHSSFAGVTSLCIRQCQENNNNNNNNEEGGRVASTAATIPVQLLSTLCRVIPNLQHLECGLVISGNDGEFREWARHLASSSGICCRLVQVILWQPAANGGDTTTTTAAKEEKESCKKWEPVVAAFLASSSIQVLKIKGTWNEADAFSYAASVKILEKTEQRPKKIRLNFPLSFRSTEEAARYYRVSRGQSSSSAVFRCSSPLNKDSFVGRYFHSHELPELSECTLHVTPKGNNVSKGRSRKEPPIISVRVSKRQLADPQQLTVELQNLLGGSNARVTPPVVSNIELFLNPRYLQSRYIYSQFPEHLWDVDAVKSKSQDYQEMVSLLREGKILGRDAAVAALYEWFLAHPNNLLHLDS